MLYLGGEIVCICGLAEVLSPQITNTIGSASRKSAKCQICGWSAYLTNFVVGKICGFAICGNLIADCSPLLTENLYFVIKLCG